MDPWVISTLTHGYKLQFRHRPPAFSWVKMTIIRDPAKANALNQELFPLLDKGAIEPVDPLSPPGGFYLTCFLVKKKDGGLRPILDLRGLNRFLKVLRFHMLSTAEVLHTVAREEWFTSIDLKNAYFYVRIALHHRPFLWFAFQGCYFLFRVLPFVLSLSPWVFTRCVVAALSPLQLQCCLLALAPWRESSFLPQGMPMGSIASRQETVTTDASLSGWGAVWQNQTARGLWPARDRSEHINVLELWAVHMALQLFLPFLRGRHVLVRSDNVSTVSHINHQGGTRSCCCKCPGTSCCGRPPA